MVTVGLDRHEIIHLIQQVDDALASRTDRHHDVKAGYLYRVVRLPGFALLILVGVGT